MPNASKYENVKKLCDVTVDDKHAAIAAEGSPSVERFGFVLLERMFFDTPDGLLPQLQCVFFSNLTGVATKVAAASTGVHGLKYGDSGLGQYNSLAAQFMPRAVCCLENNSRVEIT